MTDDFVSMTSVGPIMQALRSIIGYTLCTLSVIAVYFLMGNSWVPVYLVQKDVWLFTFSRFVFTCYIKYL